MLIIYFLKSRWVFSLPKKNKYLIVDGNYIPFVKYIKKKEITILYRRGEEINLLILLKCFLKFKFSTLDYFSEFIKIVQPKLILTAFDYHTIFYKLSKKTGVKTLMLQKGKRSNIDPIIRNKLFFPKNSKKKFFVDYMLIYNQFIKNFYSKKISGKFYCVGSFENNFKKINASKQKKQIVFISNYRQDKHKSENENLIALQLLNLSKKYKIKFNILPIYRKDKKKLFDEINYFKKVIKSKVHFIKDIKNSSYDILLKYKYVFASYSTLAVEFLAKGGRAGFVMFKSKNNPTYNYRYGLLEGLNEKGPFWTSSDKINLKETERIFKYIIKTKNEKFYKNNKKYVEKVMKYDKNNSSFLKILDKVIN